jgi:hypothetical protein
MKEIIEVASECLWLTEAQAGGIMCRALLIAIYMFNEGSRFQPASQTTNYLDKFERILTMDKVQKPNNHVQPTTCLTMLQKSKTL